MSKHNPHKHRSAIGAVRAIKKGQFEKTICLIVAALIQKFDDDGWENAKISDLVQLLVLLRGIMIKNESGQAPVDEWILSVSKRAEAEIEKKSAGGTDDQSD